VEEANKAEIREVNETNNMDVEMEKLCFFLLFSQTWERVRTQWRVVGGPPSTKLWRYLLR
jgi:hypothetical protein